MRNPFFANAPKKIAAWLFAAALVLIVVGVPLVLLFAPFMHYRSVEVSGLTTIASEDVISIVEPMLNAHRWLVFPANHIFFTNTQKVSVALNTQFHFDNLSLHRDGRTLIIDAKERITEVAVTINATTYLVDLNGVAVSGASSETLRMIAARRTNAVEIPTARGIQPTMPIIDVTGTFDVALGSVIIDATRLSHILALDDGLRTRNLLPLVYTLDTQQSPWLTVGVQNAPSLLVDISVSPEVAMVMYDVFVKENATNMPNMAYIDIRFGDHVYSKNK